MNAKRLLALMIVLGVIFCVGTPDLYADTPLEKLSRGLTNLLTGFAEYGVQLEESFHEYGPGRAFVSGFIRGTYYAIIRTLAGAYETVTFILPIPWRYHPIIRPETII